MNAAEGSSRYRLSANRHVIYDTWGTTPRAGGTPGDAPVAATFRTDLAPQIVAALNDVEQARADATSEIQTRFDQRHADLVAETQKQITSVTKQAERRIAESISGEPEDAAGRRELGIGVWLAIDAIAREVVRRALDDAFLRDEPGWEAWPDLELADWERVVARARALVQTPAYLSERFPGEGALDFLVDHRARQAKQDRGASP